jgi:hypothetical protein
VHLRGSAGVWHVIAMVRGFPIVALVGAMEIAGALGGVRVADAQPAAPPLPANLHATPLVGATEVAKFSAATGFIDDPIATDDTRIAYVIADASTKAELHVETLEGAPAGTGSGAGSAQGSASNEQIVDIASVTLHPIALRLVGKRAFVVGVNGDGNQVAALVELAAVGKKPAGAVVYKLGPAKDISVITRDGKPRIAVHRVTDGKDGVRHEVEVDALETGKRVSAGRPLELDASGANKALELKVNSWSDGYTRAHGIKGGEWDKKEDQRSPDVEATYDLVTGKFSEQKKIEDLFEQRKRFGVLAEEKDKADFLRMSWDNANIQIWHAGKPTNVTLDESMTNYDPKSLMGVVEPDGSAWLALKVDPVNPDAVARKKADPEYLDIFHAGADGKAVRKARVLGPSMRFYFGVLNDAGGKLWLLERSNGFERGGKNLKVYQLGG